MSQTNKKQTKDSRMKFDKLRGQATPYQTLFTLFIEALVAEFSPNKGIIIDSTNYNSLLPWDENIDGLSARVRRIIDGELVEETEQTSLTSISQTYGQNDLVIRFCPIGVRKPRYKLEGVGTDEVPAEYQEIWDSLNIIGENGLVFVNTTFGLFASTKGKAFQSMLEQKGYYISAAIEFPSRTYPDTALAPLVVAITKKSFNDRLFIVEVNTLTNFNAVIRNFKEIRSTDSIYEGVITQLDSFTSISNYKTIQQINDSVTFFL